MLRQGLSDPAILSLICPDDQYKLVLTRIVGVEEVGKESKEAEAACENNKLILVFELLEDVLLIFLCVLVGVDGVVNSKDPTNGSDSFTVCRSALADDI